jgi:hypothetical protein
MLITDSGSNFFIALAEVVLPGTVYFLEARQGKVIQNIKTTQLKNYNQPGGIYYYERELIKST